MDLILNINGLDYEVQVSPGESLTTALRKLGFYSVKHGCETGECGACTALLDDKTVNSCVYLAAQAEGHRIGTVEAIGEHPERGWKESLGLDQIQRAFVESGAICAQSYATHERHCHAQQSLQIRGRRSECRNIRYTQNHPTYPVFRKMGGQIGRMRKLPLRPV